jgi:phosphatidate cytidylyltransferase
MAHFRAQQSPRTTVAAAWPWRGPGWGRLIPAALLGPFVLWAATREVVPVYLLVLSAFAAVGSGEVYRLLINAGRHPGWPVGAGLAVALAADAALTGWRLAPHVVILASLATLIWTTFRGKRADGLGDWALTIGPALYVGGLLGYYVWLRVLPGGAFWVPLVLGCTWAADIAAYLCGRRWGRTKLAPTLSPGKSVEGAVAAVLAAIGLTLAVGLCAMAGLGPTVPFGGLAGLVGLGLLVAVAGIVGDLAESFVKRQLGAKDASRLLLGHGGLMDRIDSLLAAGVVAYFYLLALAWVTA